MYQKFSSNGTIYERNLKFGMIIVILRESYVLSVRTVKMVHFILGERIKLEFLNSDLVSMLVFGL